MQTLSSSTGGSKCGGAGVAHYLPPGGSSRFQRTLLPMPERCCYRQTNTDMFTRREANHKATVIFMIVGGGSNNGVGLFLGEMVFGDGAISARHKDSILGVLWVCLSERHAGLGIRRWWVTISMMGCLVGFVCSLACDDPHVSSNSASSDSGSSELDRRVPPLWAALRLARFCSPHAP